MIIPKYCGRIIKSPAPGEKMDLFWLSQICPCSLVPHSAGMAPAGSCSGWAGDGIPKDNPCVYPSFAFLNHGAELSSNQEMQHVIPAAPAGT